MICPNCKKEDPQGREMCLACGAPIKPIPVPPGGKIRFGGYDWFMLDKQDCKMLTMTPNLACCMRCPGKHTAEWEISYICKPSQFFNTNDSVFYTDNKDIADYECELIIKTQLEDGSWAIPWGWVAYPEEWAINNNWWKGNGAILNMLYLKGMIV